MRLYLGDHLITGRLGYSHHGIYAGSGMVIAKTRNGVGEFTLDEFSHGQGIDVIEHADRAFSRAQTVERAKSRIGEKGYSLLSSNCEDFANWCISGKSDSSQVRLAAAAAAGFVAAAGAAGLVLAKSSTARNAAVALVGGGGAGGGAAKIAPPPEPAPGAGKRSGGIERPSGPLRGDPAVSGACPGGVL